MKDQVKLRGLRLLPKNLVSRAFGAVSEVRFPSPVQAVVNSTFASMAGIDVHEAENPPESYPTLNAYFTRRLKPGARPVASNEDHVLVSPVDGKLGAFGPITEQTLVQAKGRQYRLVDLVDGSLEANLFKDGHYATIYLSPRDYHRIHCPTRGNVVKVGYIPGHLWPVNALAVENIDELFAVNERLISYIADTAMTRVAVIKVGATCVGRISLAFDATVTNQPLRHRRESPVEPPVAVEHGEELGAFNLGSTVILLIANPAFAFDPGLGSGQMLRLGQRMGGVPQA